MEFVERYRANLDEYKKASLGFFQALLVETGAMDEVTQDLVKNGQLQKFEYCIELSWKLGKVLLEWQSGIVVTAPKQVFRELYINKFINEEQSLQFLDAIDDRNKMSHIYKEELFVSIVDNLPLYSNLFNELLNVYEKYRK